MPDVPDVLTAAQAAAYLQVPVETLKRWRRIGTGPRYFHAGRHVRYRLAQLERWAEQREQEIAHEAGVRWREREVASGAS